MGVTVDMSGVAPKLRKLAGNPKLGKTASTEAARLMEPFVPMRNGDLAGSAATDVPWQVRYTMPYARRLFYGEGFRFSKEKHPKAMARWDKGIDKAALAETLTEAARRL